MGNDAIQQFSQAGDANGHCGTNVDAMDLSATISYDKDFFSFGKTIQVGIFFLNGRVKITGELSLDLAIAKGGAGVNVIIVKFSLPSTQENMSTCHVLASTSRSEVWEARCMPSLMLSAA